jgi:hypothetical protein
MERTAMGRKQFDRGAVYARAEPGELTLADAAPPLTWPDPVLGGQHSRDPAGRAPARGHRFFAVEQSESCMRRYNVAPFSTGEAKPMPEAEPPGDRRRAALAEPRAPVDATRWGSAARHPVWGWRYE